MKQDNRHLSADLCVCGAGTMGAGIALAAALSGLRVILFDPSAAALERSVHSAESWLSRLVEKGKLTLEASGEIAENILRTSLPEDCRAGVILEAIIEDMRAKESLLLKLEEVNGEETVLASNTSSISIALLGKTLKNPSRFAGMHFFNPATLMKLVEVVRGSETSDETVKRLTALSKKLGKVPVVCSDSPGFIVNRVARPYYLEAMKLVSQYGLTLESADRVLESAGFRMGPFRLMDMIGLDINYAVSSIVWEELGRPARLKPAEIQRAKVAAGELGRKTGKGFYEYEA